MALGIVKYFYDRPSQLIGVRLVNCQFVAFSCRGPTNSYINFNQNRIVKLVVAFLLDLVE